MAHLPGKLLPPTGSDGIDYATNRASRTGSARKSAAGNGGLISSFGADSPLRCI